MTSRFRDGVGDAVARDPRVDFRTVIVSGAARSRAAGSSFGYFFVLGQMSRHGCVFTVCVRSFTFSPVAVRFGPNEFIADFSFSDDSRKFCSVTGMLSFDAISVLILFRL